MLLPDDFYLSYFHYVYKHNLFVCTDVIMQIMLISEFTDLPHVHRCCGAGHYNPCLHRCYGAGSLFVYFQLWDGL